MPLLTLTRPKPVKVTGNCPVREHTGDGAPVGRCMYALYEGVCGRHGRLSEDVALHDDRHLPAASEQRDFGDDRVRAHLIRLGFQRPKAGLTDGQVRRLLRRNPTVGV